MRIAKNGPVTIAGQNGDRMDDLIRRQDAIDSPVKMVSEGLEWIPVYYIKELPSAEPERKKGKWDDIGGVIRYGCPFCHHSQERKSNFCPNCGADMRGKEE